MAITLPLDAAADDAGCRLAMLFDTHEERLYRLARRLTSTAGDAEDLVQETFLRAARSLTSVPDGHSREEAWLVRVLVNIRRDQWRRAVTRQRAAALLTDNDAERSTAEAALIAKQAVWTALDTLHPRRRAILILHELEGMTHSAIGTLLGVSTVTVRWHLSMARHDLKKLLETT